MVDVADAESRLEQFQRAAQRVVAVFGDALAAGRRYDGLCPLGDGGGARLVVAVGVGDALWCRLLSGVEHLVFQLHESSDDASQLSVQQVVVGV